MFNFISKLSAKQKYCLAYLRTTGVNLDECKKLYFTQNAIKERDNFILKETSIETFEQTAKDLIELWPKGLRIIDNQKYPWNTDSLNLSMRLAYLHALRNIVLPHDDIIECANKYLKAFEKDNTYMKSLKNWVFQETQEDGIVQINSTLADMLENNNEYAE